MMGEQQYWENVQEALSRIFDQCEEIDPQSDYDMLEDIQFVRGFINKHKPQTGNAMEVLKKEPCEDAVSRKKVLNTLFYNSDNNCEVVLNKELQDRIKSLPPVTPTRKKCKWILYDYRTLVPREHGNIPNPYWRIPARYKTELKYCPYCGGEIDYSEVDAEIEKRGSAE